jgi:hypothetical protein
VGLLLALGLLSVVAAQARPPEIVVSPSKVAPGKSVTVYGFDFCPTTSCDPVSIFVDDDLVSSNVDVNDEGVFQDTFKVDQTLGNYTARATQKTNDGSTLEDTDPFQVVNVTPSPVAGTRAPTGSTTPTPDGSGAASPATSPGADGGETPAPGEGSPGDSPAPRETGAEPSPPCADCGGGDDSGIPWLALGAALFAGAVAAGAFFILRRRRK